MDRMELGAFIAQGAAAGRMDHALACLLGLLGLRVSEACSINIEDLSTERGPDGHGATVGQTGRRDEAY
jgi:integrase